AETLLAHMGLLAADLDLIAPTHIVLIVPEGGDAKELRRALTGVSLPGAVVQEVREGETLPASSPAHGKTAIGGKATAYVCIGPQCSRPVTDPAALVKTVKASRQVSVA
ncbi:MAG: thioredoxin domain-containing protein, partial [Thermoanaerobaculia bacterium]